MAASQEAPQPEIALFKNLTNQSLSYETTKVCSLDESIVNDFGKAWHNAVDDNYLTLFGFRRYRTSHLLNLRLLEAEIAKIDHTFFQAGLNLNHIPTLDRLGLSGARRDAIPPKEAINEAQVLRLRELLKQYDEALTSFNQIMTMETFSLADNPSRSGARIDLETYKTRLVRVDLPRRNTSRDPIQHYLRKIVRRIWYFGPHFKSRLFDEESSRPVSSAKASLDRSCLNTARVAEVATRFLVAVLAGAFLVLPLIMLTFEESKESHLITVSIFIIVFSLLVSLLSKASNYETMAATAAYAAVLSVFVSSNT